MPKIKKRMITLFITITIIAGTSLYLYLISGGIPSLEYSFNTRYSQDYNKSIFQGISQGMSISDVIIKIGSPIVEKDYTDSRISISIYYYSYLKKGNYWGKVGNINARILIVSEGIIIAKISEVLPIYKLKPKYISSNFIKY